LAVGVGVGFFVGETVGCFVGGSVGCLEGFCVGVEVGGYVGLLVGSGVGFTVGLLDGRCVGFCVGVFVGRFDGGGVGSAVDGLLPASVVMDVDVSSARRNFNVSPMQGGTNPMKHAKTVKIIVTPNIGGSIFGLDVRNMSRSTVYGF
jgi:hypothetical protein